MVKFTLVIPALALVTLLSACQTVPVTEYMPPERQLEGAEKDYAEKQFAIYDPIEGTNKYVYKFNAELDEYVLLPVVDAYEYVTPEFLRTRVSRFFLNVGELGNFTNSILQIKPGEAATTLGRFGINTTVGLLGTFDVASDWGLERQPEDFGKTLGHYGAGAGPYVVLPFLSPSNLRDTAGVVVDYATLMFVVPNDVEDTTAYKVVAYGLQPLDMRYSNKFRYFESGTPFEYELVRYISVTARQMQIDKGKMADPEPAKSPETP